METLRPRHPVGLPLSGVQQAGDGVRLLPNTAGQTRVSGVTLDSRAVQPGDLYAALPGAQVHGARFIGSAADAGAAAVLTDPVGQGIVTADGLQHRLPLLLAADPRGQLGAICAAVYGHPAQHLTMLGITGTNGKTTVAHILDAALTRIGRLTGLIGTIETRVAGERVASVRTTPESPDLHALFARMREANVDTCVMEVSSHALELHRVDGVAYDAVAFTNLSQDHLDFHRTMSEYYQAKARLFTASRARAGVVVVDDEWGRRLAADAEIPVLTLASQPTQTADWQMRPSSPGGAVELDGPNGRLRLQPAVPGRHNRINTAVAALMLLSVGVAAADIEAALSEPVRVPGRMERVELGEEAPAVYVDYAHTPDAVTATLAVLRQESPAPLVVVLGAGGGRDVSKRSAMGRAAADGADQVVVTDDNPRHEDPATIRAAVLSGTGPPAAGPRPTVREVADRSAAIRAGLELAAGGTLAILGKGHEQGQEIAGMTQPFDDRDTVRRVWRELGAVGSGPTS